MIFSKYVKTKYRSGRGAAPAPAGVKDGWLPRLRALVLPGAEPVTQATFFGRLALWAFFSLWGLRLLWMEFESNAIGSSFMHIINLMFHEAGHPIFGLFGRFMGVLGGSLMQLLMPAAVVVSFLIARRDAFGASFGFWWFGVSLMDMAPYIADARAMQLVLLGGGTGMDRPGMHDWNNLLGWAGLLEYDQAIAWLVDASGELTVLAAIVWGAVLLKRQYDAGLR